MSEAAAKIKYDFPLETIPLSEIDVRSFKNSRTRLKSSDVKDLENSIKLYGVLHPPIVRRKKLELIALQEKGVVPGDPDCGYEVIAGFRRVLAVTSLHNQSKGALFEELKVAVADVSDHDARMINLSENVHRKSLLFADESSALYELEQLGYSGQEIADRLGVKRGWVAQRLSFRKHADPELVEVVELQILQFSKAYQIFRQLGGSKPKRKDKEAQKAVAKAATRANRDYMDRVNNNVEVLSNKKKFSITSRVADAEAKKLKLRETGRKPGSQALIYSEAVDIIRALESTYMASGELPDYEQGVLDALYAFTGVRNAPDLHSRYAAGINTLQTANKRGRKSKEVRVCQAEVLVYDENRNPSPGFCGELLDEDSDGVFCSLHEN